MEGIPLFEADICHVFKIPSGGDQLKSELWEGNHIWSGSIRVFQDRLELFDSNGVFGACPLRDEPDAPIPVRPTSDSRRCFVVRVEQGGLFAYLGINFETHSIAFQFHTAVLERHRTAVNREVDTVEVHDRRLAPGQTFSVELTGKIRVKDSAAVVSQKIEDYSAPVTQPSTAGFNFAAGLQSRTGASRRVGAASAETHAPAANASPPSSGGSPVIQQPQQPQQPQPPKKADTLDFLSDIGAPAPAATSTGSTGSNPRATASLDFDFFGGGPAPHQPAQHQQAPPQHQQTRAAPSNSSDAFDVFSGSATVPQQRPAPAAPTQPSRPRDALDDLFA
jgi:hypothetical protein